MLATDINPGGVLSQRMEDADGATTDDFPAPLANVAAPPFSEASKELLCALEFPQGRVDIPRSKNQRKVSTSSSSPWVIESN
jgi:hypothetical protein